MKQMRMREAFHECYLEYVSQAMPLSISIDETIGALHT